MNHQNFPPQNQQAAFMPFPMIVQQQGAERYVNEAPARVMVALRYLNDCTIKQMKRVVGNDVGFHELDGLQLCETEKYAQSAAGKLLADYFGGKFGEDKWEKDQQKQGREGAGAILHCMACRPNPPRPDCYLCHGTGTVIVYPHTSER